MEKQLKAKSPCSYGICILGQGEHQNRYVILTEIGDKGNKVGKG